MNNFLKNIRQKPESYKRGVALGLSLTITLVIALGWLGQRGIIGVGEGEVARELKINRPTDTVAVANVASPIESSKQSALSGFEAIKKAYLDFKESIASVLVPFITGIEVYERK